MNQVEQPRIWLFWSWTPNWWWSWIKTLLNKVWSDDLKAHIALVVSNYSNWWVKLNADNAWIPFHYMADFPKRWENGEFSLVDLAIIKNLYLEVIKNHWLEYVFLSWWLKYVLWLTPNKTVNIHPWPTK